MEQAWDALIANGWDALTIRNFLNIDPVTGESTYSYGTTVNTPEGAVVIEKADAATSTTALANAMQVIGPASDYDEEVLRSTVQRSELDQQERDTKRDYDAAQYQAA